MFRIGQGFDVHQFAPGRPCIIGGVEIPHEQGLTGHSDADVLLHTIADAALGAIGEEISGNTFLIQTRHIKMRIQRNCFVMSGRLWNKKGSL